tara:strand:+ start:335 stop:1075 length:741 start_codon:yes stop_codon:yes gene_type:complete
MTSLGVNIDHIANVRQARQTNEPDPVPMALLAELGGADGITIHLREDRRHIQDRDLKILRETVNSKLNLEMAATEEMIQIAIETKPDMVTLVPEKRQEITTEGGLDLLTNLTDIKSCTNSIQSEGIPVSLFIDPIREQIDAAKQVNAILIELHTGNYASASSNNQTLELAKIKEATSYAKTIGLRVNAGHGLTYQNVEAIALIEGMEELNIGHTIISRSLAVGLKEAVKEMKYLINNPRKNYLSKN